MMKYLPFLLFLLLKAGTATAQNNLVINGIPWFDDKGNIVNAHGACIVEENGRYYLFGEWKSDKSNAFPGFSCYYNPQIQISAESGTKRSIFRQKNKTKRSKKRLHTTLIKPEQKVNEDLCSGFIVS